MTNQAAPAVMLRKSERVGSSGSFTHGPVTGDVGDTVNYRMMVTNTGNTTLVIDFTDSRCDSGTLSGPTVLSGVFDAATKTLSLVASFSTRARMCWPRVISLIRIPRRLWARRPRPACERHGFGQGVRECAGHEGRQASA